jgi:hypothetical protein
MFRDVVIAGLGVAVGALLVLNEKRKRRRRGPQMLLTLKFDNNNKVKGQLMAVTLTSTQFVEGTLQPVDSKGRPAQVDENSVTFVSSDPNVFVAEQDPNDQLKVKITAVGEGVAELRYTADADLDDEETVSIEGFTAVEVLPAMAIGFGIQFSTPQEQPEQTSSTTTSTTSTEFVP